MSMSAINANDWAGMNGATESLSFQLSLATLNSILTQDVLNTALPFGDGGMQQGQPNGSFYPFATPPSPGSPPPNQTNWVNTLGTPGFNPEPNTLMAILDAALAGGGMTALLPGLQPIPQSTATAERLYRGDPLKARALVAQIVAACIAAG